MSPAAPKPPPGRKRRRRPVDSEKSEAKALLREHRRISRLAVIARARLQVGWQPAMGGRCEWVGCPDAGQAWHHACGRGGKGIVEPAASSPALTTWLCNHHHGQAHSMSWVAEALRLAAAKRLGLTVDMTETTPLRAIREALCAAPSGPY